MKFTFGIDHFTPIEGKPHTSKVMTLETEAETVEEAYAKIEPLIPAGHRMWYWHTDERVTDEEEAEPKDHP